MRMHHATDMTLDRLAPRFRRSWHGLAANDRRYDPDAEYFQRIRDALNRQLIDGS